MENELIDELIYLGDRLSYIFYYGWFLPLNHEKEEKILKRMKEIVDELSKRKIGEVI